MPKLRKMLGDVNSAECISLMKLIETQSKSTLAAWAVGYVKENYLGIYEAAYPEDHRLRDAVSACEECLTGAKKLSEIKPVLKEAAQSARDAADHPVGQAAARAVSTACGILQTPTNALGFIFYGAAASAYSQAGLDEKREVYDRLAENEFKKVYASLKKAAVTDEPNPVKVKWNC